MIKEETNTYEENKHLVSLSREDMKSIVGAYNAHGIEVGMSEADVRARRSVREALEALNPES